MLTDFYHICNYAVSNLHKLKNISSFDELNEVSENEGTIYIVNIHLSWGNRKHSANYGFDIANLIRTKKRSKAPVIFYSPIQREYFEHKMALTSSLRLIFIEYHWFNF